MYHALHTRTEPSWNIPLYLPTLSFLFIQYLYTHKHTHTHMHSQPWSMSRPREPSLRLAGSRTASSRLVNVSVLSPTKPGIKCWHGSKIKIWIYIIIIPGEKLSMTLSTKNWLSSRLCEIFLWFAVCLVASCQNADFFPGMIYIMVSVKHSYNNR